MEFFETAKVAVTAIVAAIATAVPTFFTAYVYFRKKMLELHQLAEENEAAMRKRANAEKEEEIDRALARMQTILNGRDLEIERRDRRISEMEAKLDAKNDLYEKKIQEMEVKHDAEVAKCNQDRLEAMKITTQQTAMIENLKSRVGELEQARPSKRSS